MAFDDFHWFIRFCTKLAPLCLRFFQVVHEKLRIICWKTTCSSQKSKQIQHKNIFRWKNSKKIDERYLSEEPYRINNFRYSLWEKTFDEAISQLFEQICISRMLRGVQLNLKHMYEPVKNKKDSFFDSFNRFYFSIFFPTEIHSFSVSFAFRKPNKSSASSTCTWDRRANTTDREICLRLAAI